MNKVTIKASTEKEAVEICTREHFVPSAVREVDSGDEDQHVWMCFESGADADLWDNQQ